MKQIFEYDYKQGCKDNEDYAQIVLTIRHLFGADLDCRASNLNALCLKCANVAKEGQGIFKIYIDDKKIAVLMEIDAPTLRLSSALLQEMNAMTGELVVSKNEDKELLSIRILV